MLRIILLIGVMFSYSLAEAALSIVPTFKSLSVYVTEGPAPADAKKPEARLQVRRTGTSPWYDALPLWYDARVKKYKGSIVGLVEGMSYDVRVIFDNGTALSAAAKTWSPTKKILKTVYLPASSSVPLEIAESGSASGGYILYTPKPGQKAVIDVKKAHDYNIRIRAKYVIVRGVTLKGSTGNGILLGSTTSDNSEDLSDIIIEQNDISDWGSLATNDPTCQTKYKTTKRYGKNMQAAVYSRSTKLTRMIVQRNKLHHPTYGANSWKEMNCATNAKTKHPNGPQALSIFKSAGNHVIRFNEIYSTAGRYFNDSMGETSNFSKIGFPNKDSDINGNLIRHCWDDGLEIEGANENVRVYHNYIDETYGKVAVAPTVYGPVYVFRNIANVSRTSPTAAYGQSFLKFRQCLNSTCKIGSGRVYVLNNTVLNPTTGPGIQSFVGEFDQENRFQNLLVYNNIIQMHSPSKNYAISESYALTSVFDYNLISGLTKFSSEQQVNGLKGVPTFVSGVLDEATLSGNFGLTSSSLGYRDGLKLPNFAKGTDGKAPNMGAQEVGTELMYFGVNAK